MLFNNVCFGLNRRETQLDLLWNHFREVLRFVDKLCTCTFFSRNRGAVVSYLKETERKISRPGYHSAIFSLLSHYLSLLLATEFSSPQSSLLPLGPHRITPFRPQTFMEIWVRGQSPAGSKSHRSKQLHTCSWQTVAQTIPWVMSLERGNCRVQGVRGLCGRCQPSRERVVHAQTWRVGRNQQRKYVGKSGLGLTDDTVL